MKIRSGAAKKVNKIADLYGRKIGIQRTNKTIKEAKHMLINLTKKKNLVDTFLFLITLLLVSLIPKEYQFSTKNSNQKIARVNAMQKLPVFCHAIISGFMTMD
jgi:hypothetical protein